MKKGTTMKRPDPSGREITFPFDELFFSRTNERGVIIYGNEVFVRISGYQPNDLVGQPHSIIRHPDMPRSVFKLLWDTIQTGQPIAAYVKNLAANGDAYWVMAVVFPFKNEYLSIRLCPSSAFFQLVKGVYETMLKEEETNGVEAATNLLVETLKQGGFADYPRFMTTALIAEMSERDAKVNAQAHSSTKVGITSVNGSDTIELIQSVTQAARSKFMVLSEKMAEFEEASHAFQEKTTALLTSFVRIQVVSLNVTVFARQLGESAVALGVISKEFHRMAMDVERSTKELGIVINKLLQNMQKSSLDIASLKLQMDMVSFFTAESLTHMDDGTTSIAQAFRPLEENSAVFKGVGSATAKSAGEAVTELRRQLMAFAKENESIDRVIQTLEIINQMAALESARIIAHQVAFASYLQQMEQFNLVLKATTTDIKHATENLLSILTFVEERLPEVTGALDQILELALAAKHSK
jgi:aerotaxis receptor